MSLKPRLALRSTHARFRLSPKHASRLRPATERSTVRDSAAAATRRHTRRTIGLKVRGRLASPCINIRSRHKEREREREREGETKRVPHCSPSSCSSRESSTRSNTGDHRSWMKLRSFYSADVSESIIGFDSGRANPRRGEHRD